MFTLKELFRSRNIIILSALLSIALLETSCAPSSPTTDDIDIRLQPPVALNCNPLEPNYKSDSRTIEHVIPGDIVAINDKVVIQVRQDGAKNIAISALSVSDFMEDDLSYKSTTALMNREGKVNGLAIEIMRGMGGLATFTTTFTMNNEEKLTLSIQGSCNK